MRPARSLPRWLLALCLLASAWQGFVQQAHVHAAPAFGAAGLLADAGSPAPTEPNCILCDAAAHSPAIAPPDAVGAFALLPPAPSASPSRAFTTFSSRASHHWLGRGPPTA